MDSQVPSRSNGIAVPRTLLALFGGGVVWYMTQLGARMIGDPEFRYMSLPGRSAPPRLLGVVDGTPLGIAMLVATASVLALVIVGVIGRANPWWVGVSFLAMTVFGFIELATLEPHARDAFEVLALFMLGGGRTVLVCGLLGLLALVSRRRQQPASGEEPAPEES